MEALGLPENADEEGDQELSSCFTDAFVLPPSPREVSLDSRDHLAALEANYDPDWAPPAVRPTPNPLENDTQYQTLATGDRDINAVFGLGTEETQSTGTLKYVYPDPSTLDDAARVYPSAERLCSVPGTILPQKRGYEDGYSTSSRLAASLKSDHQDRPLRKTRCRKSSIDRTEKHRRSNIDMVDISSLGSQQQHPDQATHPLHQIARPDTEILWTLEGKITLSTCLVRVKNSVGSVTDSHKLVCLISATTPITSLGYDHPMTVYHQQWKESFQSGLHEKGAGHMKVIGRKAFDHIRGEGLFPQESRWEHLAPQNVLSRTLSSTDHTAHYINGRRIRIPHTFVAEVLRDMSRLDKTRWRSISSPASRQSSFKETDIEAKVLAALHYTDVGDHHYLLACAVSPAPNNSVEHCDKSMKNLYHVWSTLLKPEISRGANHYLSFSVGDAMIITKNWDSTLRNCRTQYLSTKGILRLSTRGNQLSPDENLAYYIDGERVRDMEIFQTEMTRRTEESHARAWRRLLESDASPLQWSTTG